MNNHAHDIENPFLLKNSHSRSLHHKAKLPLIKGVERISGLSSCQKLYKRLMEEEADHNDFAANALDVLGVSYSITEPALSRIPKTGPCILIANHPFGGIEGLILFDLLKKVRPDAKIMANFLLGRIPQLRDQMITVDPFGGGSSAKNNLGPMRESLKWLKKGGLLVIFPAGVVSSRQSKEVGVSDPQWTMTLPRLVKSSKAPVLPVFFPGKNGPLFQLAGQVHHRLRTLLLPRMLTNKRGQTFDVLVGNSIAYKKLATFGNDGEMNDYLRMRTYALALDKGKDKSDAQEGEASGLQRIRKPLATERLVSEVEFLRKNDGQLLESGDFEILLFEGDEAPTLLEEIGRLRELTFREVGEGTGECIDLDRFDRDYSHLFLWNREKNEIVGAYRIGRIDEIMMEKGIEGLYTSTLFELAPELLTKLNYSLELGRSFIRPEYQRSYAPLLLLWKGIGSFLVKNPWYRYLFGPVSISNDYSENSRQLMTSTLGRFYQIEELSNLVSPRIPVPLKPVQIPGLPKQRRDDLLKDMDDISALVADLEPDNKGIPVLLRHYLNLGGRLLAFNLDPDFSDVIDGLLLVDMVKTDPKQLKRYLGKEGYEEYLRHQQSIACCA